MAIVARAAVQGATTTPPLAANLDGEAHTLALDRVNQRTLDLQSGEAVQLELVGAKDPGCGRVQVQAGQGFAELGLWFRQGDAPPRQSRGPAPALEVCLGQDESRSLVVLGHVGAGEVQVRVTPLPSPGRSAASPGKQAD